MRSPLLPHTRFAWYFVYDQETKTGTLLIPENKSYYGEKDGYVMQNGWTGQHFSHIALTRCCAVLCVSLSRH